MSVTEKIKTIRDTEIQKTSVNSIGLRIQGNVNPLENLFQGYADTLPAAIEEQKRMFNELKGLGIIGMLKELTISDIEEPESPLRKGIRVRIGKLTKHSWVARLPKPRMYSDRSAEASPLTIFLENHSETAHNTKQMAQVKVSYSSNGKLEIEGNEVSFNGLINKDNIEQNRDEIENSLAIAFTRPKFYLWYRGWQEFGKKVNPQEP